MVTNNAIDLSAQGIAYYDGAGTFSVPTITNHAFVIGAAAGNIKTLGAATNGQLAIGSNGSDPVLATLTAGTGISIANAAGSITLSVNGSVVGETITGNSGGALSPTAGNWNIVGTGSLTTSGSGSTLTAQLTGLTNHNVLIGAGTATITNVAPSATSGVPLISQGAAADPAFGTAVVAGGGTGATSFNINGVVISNTTTTGALASLTLTNGQVVIGSTGNPPAAATLTAGTGISITNASNSITIASTGGGFTWTDVTGATQTLAAQNGYITDHAATVVYTLPASGTLGDIIKIVGKTGLATITPNANQQILIGSASGTVGVTGTAVSNNAGDCIELICITAGASTVWRADAMIGTWTLN